MPEFSCVGCGSRTKPDSTYCTTCRWAIISDTPRLDEALDAASGAWVQIPVGWGPLKHQRLKIQATRLQSQLRRQIEKKTVALEAQQKKDLQNFETHHALGVLRMIERHWDSAEVHLETACRLHSKSLEIQVNTAAVMAQRGKYHPALEMLNQAHQAWPNSPLVAFKKAVIALEARQPSQALRAVEVLEDLCHAKPATRSEYYEAALTLRGLALLQQGHLPQAQQALFVALQHQVSGDEAGVASKLSDSSTSSKPLSSSERADTGEGGAGLAEAEDGADFQTCPLKSAQSEMHNNLGLVEAAAGNSRDAIKRLGLALSMEPESPRLHNNLGVLAYQHGYPRLARHHMELARRLEEATGSVQSSTHNHLGVIYAALGDRDKSLQHFRRASGYERMEFETWYNLGHFALEAARQKDAVTHLRRAHEINPRHPDLQVLMGIAYWMSRQSGLTTEALKSFKKALHLQADHYVATVNMTLALMEASHPAETIARVIHQVRKMRPDGGEAPFLHGLLLLKDGERGILGAQQAFAQSAQARPDLLAATYNLALCEYCAGLHAGAMVRLQRILNNDPYFGPAYYLLGFGHTQAKQFEKALETWLKAMPYEPDNAALQANLGFVYYQLGQWLKAAAAYERAFEMAPDQFDLLSCIGLCYARAGNQMNEAHEEQMVRRANPLRNVTKQQKEQNEAEHAKEIKEWTEVMEKAIACFTRQLLHQPNDHIVHSNLGIAFWYNKQVEKAVDEWRIVGRIDARYAARFTSIEQHTYDESGLVLRPFNWQQHVVKLAPLLPRPQLRLIPATHEPALNPAPPDAELESLRVTRHELDCALRGLAWSELSQEQKQMPQAGA